MAHGRWRLGDDSRLSRQVKCRYQSPSEDTAAHIAELACCDSRSQPSSHCRQLLTANVCDYRMQRCEQNYMTKFQLATARHVLPTQGGAVWVNMDAKARPRFGELDKSSISTNCRSSEKGGSHKSSLLTSYRPVRTDHARFYTTMAIFTSGRVHRKCLDVLRRPRVRAESTDSRSSARW